MIGQIAKITFYLPIFTICGDKLKQTLTYFFKHEPMVSRSHYLKYQTQLQLHQVIMA